MHENILAQTWAESNYSPAQETALRRIAQRAPGWFGFEKGKKVPRATRGPGNTSDPGKAMLLDEALQQMQRQGWGGVSVLMTSADPELVGVDIDHCLVEGVPNALASEALQRFAGAYVELSPSGTGLRMFSLGSVPAEAPTKRTLPDGVGVEVYPGGARRHLRMTGDLVPGTAGEVLACQSGIDWLIEVMTHRTPDNASEAGTDSAKRGAGTRRMRLDDVLAELGELREARVPADIINAMKTYASNKPRSKLASLLRGDLGAWGDDWSTADRFACCEALRRGAGSFDDVVEVWHSTVLGKRPANRHPEKIKRKDYLQSTVEDAARAVLEDLRKVAARAGSGATAARAVELPEDLAKALERSGDRLVYGRAGRLSNDPGNVVVLFRNAPQLQGLLGFNELAQVPYRLGCWQVFDRGAASEAGPLTDDDVTRVTMYLGREFGMRLEHKDLLRSLGAAARDAAFDPLRDRLLELGRAWDGLNRLDSWLVKVAKVDDTGCSDYVRATGRVFMVSAVARALRPGCKVDSMLAIEGAGGGGKSSMFQVLADAVAPGLFTDGVQDVSNPTALVEATGGRWLVELAELAGVRRAADVEALKASLTRTEDTHRTPYEALPRARPRRFVFVASTNRSEYLNDPSGALLRRFLPVRTLASERDPIDIQALSALAPQLWGEAVARFQRGERWHLSPDDGEAYKQWTAHREQRREDGVWTDELTDYLGVWVVDHLAGDFRGRELKTIAKAIGDVRTVEGDQTSRLRLADSLRALGMTCDKRGGKKRWTFTDEGKRRALLSIEAERRMAVA